MIDSHSAKLAIIISYPTSASGIIVLLKTPPKYRKLVRQSQIVRSVTQYYQYDLSHLLPVCNSFVKTVRVTVVFYFEFPSF